MSPEDLRTLQIFHDEFVRQKETKFRLFGLEWEVTRPPRNYDGTRPTRNYTIECTTNPKMKVKSQYTTPIFLHTSISCYLLHEVLNT